MNFIMKGMFAALALTAFTSFASAESVTLCTGKVGGGYDSLTKEIGNELTRQGHTVKILNLGGSEDIINNLASGKCDYGPVKVRIVDGVIQNET